MAPAFSICSHPLPVLISAFGATPAIKKSIVLLFPGAHLQTICSMAPNHRTTFQSANNADSYLSGLHHSNLHFI